MEEKKATLENKTQNYPIKKNIMKSHLGVDAFRIENGTVILDHADAPGPSTVEVPHGVQTDVTETLDDEGLTLPAGLQAAHVHVVALVDEVLQAVEDASTGGGDATVDAALVDRLARNARMVVDVLIADGLGVGVSQPGHLPLACAHVGGRYVYAGPLNR